jgi:hypothetical protein
MVSYSLLAKPSTKLPKQLRLTEMEVVVLCVSDESQDHDGVQKSYLAILVSTFLHHPLFIRGSPYVLRTVWLPCSEPGNVPKVPLP